jgi:hypothetical protein
MKYKAAATAAASLVVSNLRCVEGVKLAAVSVQHFDGKSM